MQSSKITSRKRRRVFALVAFLIPFLLLFLLEAGLRVFGFGQTYPLFVPVPEAPLYLRVNRQIVRRYMTDEAKTPNLWVRPVYFRKKKREGAFRIFVQGGSTAEGYPYGFCASLAGMLQQRIQRTFPHRDIEVVTTAMSAVNSYTLLDFTNEILESDPDAVLIYAGHNEYVGLLGVASGFSVGLHRPAVLAFLWLRDLRIFQLLQRAVSRTKPKKKSNRTLMATIVREKKIPLGSPLYQRGLEQYRANLSSILSRYRRARIPVFIGTVVCNERDQPPFISGFSPGTDVDAWLDHFNAGREALETGDLSDALGEFRRAVEIDDAHAKGHFGLAQALDRLGRYSDARSAYLAAKDRDELRFRAPEEINRIIRDVAAERGAHLVDVQAAFVAAACDGIVGHDLMLEHLHPNLHGYFLMADAYYEALRKSELIGVWEKPISSEQAWHEIPVSEVDRLYGEYRIRRLTSDWPFAERPVPVVIAPAASVVERIAQAYYKGRYEWPDAMHKLLDHYSSVGDEHEGAKVAVLLAEAFPNQAKRQLIAAELLLRSRRPEASVYLERALEIASPRDRARILTLQKELREEGGVHPEDGLEAENRADVVRE